MVSIGASAWSQPSATLVTASGPPDAPAILSTLQADVGYSTVALRWLRGSNNGDSVTAYDVQYRVVGQSTWQQVSRVDVYR